MAFSGTAKVLYGLSGKKEFIWTESCQKAFDSLKEKLVSAPIVCHPDFEKEFILNVDGSYQGLGYILSQLNDKGNEVVVQYGSRSLKANEKHFSPTMLEATALVEGVKFYHRFLADKKFKIVTDHQALKFIFGNKNSSNHKLVRMSLELMEYQFHIEYRKRLKAPKC